MKRRYEHPHPTIPTLGQLKTRAGYTDATVEAHTRQRDRSEPPTHPRQAAAEHGDRIAHKGIFTGATVGPAAFRQAITPELLASIARALGTSGNAVYLVDLQDGLLTFHPALDWDISGKSLDPGRWSYRLKLAVPSGEIERTAGAARVLHCRVNESPAKPWAGRSPLSLAGLTAETLANVERSLSMDGSAPTAYAVAMPDGATLAQRQGLAADVRNAKGRMIFPESMRHGIGQGKVAGTERDIQAVRLGGVAPESNVSLADAATVRVLQSFGLSAGYFGSGDAVRESRRAFFLDVVMPWARRVEGALTTLTGLGLTLNFDGAQWRDHQRLSRAYASYVKAGLEPADVLAAMGLDGIAERPDFERDADAAAGHMARRHGWAGMSTARRLRTAAPRIRAPSASTGLGYPWHQPQ